MRTLIYMLVVIFTTANVECKEGLPSADSSDSLKLCYQQVGDGDKEISWENRRFTCFHACMMEQRGEMENGKVYLSKYIENHNKDHNTSVSENGEVAITECVTKANEKKDKCDVAAEMGKCVTDKWQLITNGEK